jgi:hypothetical protein
MGRLPFHSKVETKPTIHNHSDVNNAKAAPFKYIFSWVRRGPRIIYTRDDNSLEKENSLGWRQNPIPKPDPMNDMLEFQQGLEKDLKLT